jgi:hypothetical protein
MTIACESPLALLLEEGPLEPDQSVGTLVDGAQQIAVSVRDSPELRWWLLERADQVEFLAPDWLRTESGEVVRRAATRYATFPGSR